MKLSLAHSFLAPLALLAVACGAASAEDGVPTDPQSDGVVVAVDDRGAETKIYSTGGSTGGNSAAKCYVLACPEGQQDGCFVPCVKGGMSNSNCAAKCGCTLTEKACTNSTYVR